MKAFLFTFSFFLFGFFFPQKTELAAQEAVLASPSSISQNPPSLETEKKTVFGEVSAEVSSEKVAAGALEKPESATSPALEPQSSGSAPASSKIPDYHWLKMPFLKNIRPSLPVSFAPPLKESLSEDPLLPRAEGVKLKGLFFLPAEAELSSSEELPNGIAIDKLQIPDRELFLKKMQVFLGRTIDARLLEDLKIAIVNYYWQGGYPLVRAIIPAGQEVSSGKLQVVILSSKLGRIKVEGKRSSSDEKIKKAIHLKEGETIYSYDLLNDVAWLENDPFRTVDVIYEPGEKLGTTDIVLNVREKSPPIRVYGGYENNPYKSAGPSRFKAGFSWGRLFYLDHQLNLEFASSRKIGRWYSICGNYIIPFPWRHTLKLFYNYDRSMPTAQELNIPYGTLTVGQLWQLGARFEVHLKNCKNYSHHFQLGYDFKRSNNTMDYYGYNVTRQQADISQFLLRYEGASMDSYGKTMFGFSFYFSPGGMTAFDRNCYYKDQRDGAQSDYFYGTFNLDRYQHIWKNWTWVVRMLLQDATGKLLATEEFSLGGHLTVRGYLENEVLGDRGFLLKNELRTPPFALFRGWKDSLQFLLFLDFGASNTVDQHVLSKHSAVLLSVGPGLRYNLQEYIDIRFDYGRQLKTVRGQLFGQHLHGRGYLGAYLSF
ncbi:MAG: ShlB/FhaC/HecB family hemolysin secretion/activation protein [Parachlamydiales bacterium]